MLFAATSTLGIVRVGLLPDEQVWQEGICQSFRRIRSPSRQQFMPSRQIPWGSRITSAYQRWEQLSHIIGNSGNKFWHSYDDTFGNVVGKFDTSLKHFGFHCKLLGTNWNNKEVLTVTLNWTLDWSCNPYFISKLSVTVKWAKPGIIQWKICKNLSSR